MGQPFLMGRFKNTHNKGGQHMVYLRLNSPVAGHFIIQFF